MKEDKGSTSVEPAVCCIHVDEDTKKCLWVRKLNFAARRLKLKVEQSMTRRISTRWSSWIMSCPAPQTWHNKWKMDSTPILG